MGLFYQLKMHRQKNKGFTLVELLVVIAIIGILASVVLVSLNSARSKARDAKRISDLHQISLALENYYDANQAYPTGITGANVSLLDPPDTQSPYLTSEPKDPTTGASYTYNSAGCGTTPANQKYALKTTLENFHTALNSDIDGTNCTVVCDATGSAERDYCIMP